MIEHNKINKLVYDIIKEEATEKEPINQCDIISRLSEDPENECDRRTVSRALRKLMDEYGPDEDGNWPDENIKLHYSVRARSSSPVYHSFWFEICDADDNGFTDEELMFLMDAVQFSKHIDQKYAEEITGKLAKLSHNSYSGVFRAFTAVNEKNVPIKKDFFLIIGDINTAIQQQNMISFYVNRYGVDKKLHHVSDEPVKVCPYNIVVSDGYYYLLCGDKESNAINNYRLDLVTDVTIEDETFTHSQARKTAALHPNDYLFEHRYMNSGETVNVTLTIDRSILGDVIDSFGTKIRIDPEDDSSNRLTVHVKSSEKDIIDWAMRYGEYAVINDPDYLRNAISEKARLISNFYKKDNDQYIEYSERIEKASRFHRLQLINIDLNGRESYKHLENIHTVVLRHNGIRDFSFLTSYTDLRDLTISHNEITTPEAISQLSGLRVLNLEMTGIRNLNLLFGLEHLTRLTIHEFSLENLEGLYSLPNLRSLTVNKPVSRLIDKRRLKRAYGDSLKFNVDDHCGTLSLHIRGSALPPEDNTFRPIYRRDEEAARDFSTFEIPNAAKEALCPLIFSGLRYHYGDGKLFSLVDESCDSEERKRLYEDLAHYTGNEYTWFVTCEGEPAGNAADIDTDKVSVISVFRHDHGLKLVCTARRIPTRDSLENHSFRDPLGRPVAAWHAHVRYLMDSGNCWAEISGDLENSFIWTCTMNDVIDPAVLQSHKVFRDIEIDGDDYHYYRPDDSGKKNVKKICYGHIVI